MIMYKFLLLLFFPLMLFSQTQKIEGTVVNVQNEKLPLVTIEVYDSQNTLIKKLMTGENGDFSIDGISETSIKLIFNDLEYNQLEETIDLVKNKKPLTIVMRKNIQDIDEVFMVKQKPVVIRKIDRLSFNVENSNISSLNAW